MIITRRRVGLRIWTFSTSRPICLRRPLAREMRLARRDDYVASSDYESACMDGDRIAADRIRDAALVRWIRKMGSYSAARIPRPVARS